MANKKMYFYSLDIVNKTTGENVNDKFKEIFNEIVTEHFSSSTYEDYSSGQPVDTTIFTNTIKIDYKDISIDIIENTNEYLFIRSGKTKDVSELAKRLKNQNRSQAVLSAEEDASIEIFTHFFIDYKKMIMGFILGQGAPRTNILQEIFNKYKNEYFDITISNIMIESSVQELITDEAILNKIYFDIAAPSPEIFAKLNIDPKTMLNVINNPEYVLEITLKSKKPKGFILKEKNKIVSLITNITNSLKNNDDVLNSHIQGKKSKKSKQEDFYFDQREYTKNINIKTSKFENKQKIYFCPDEITSELNTDIIMEYKKHKNDILDLCGRIEVCYNE